MILKFTPEEQARLDRLKRLSWEEDCAGAANGYLKITFSGIGEAAVWVGDDGKQTLINVEDCDNA